MKIIFTVMVLILLQGCATAVVTVLGFDTAVVGGATVASDAAVAAESLDIAKTVGDGVSYLDSGKTLTDRFTSYVTGKDCNTWRKIREGTNYCIEEIELNQPVVEE